MSATRGRGVLVLAVAASIEAAAAACTRQPHRFFTTGEPGDREGFECLACPTQSVADYRERPNDHPGPFSEAEEFVLDYWAAMNAGEAERASDHYAGSGILIRAGGPGVSGKDLLDPRAPFDHSRPYAGQRGRGGTLRFFYEAFLGGTTFEGTGGLFSTANGTGGMHVAIQDVTHVSEDFAIVSCIMNGTLYDRGSGAPYYPWIAAKQSITLRKFPGGLGWRIVQFTCSLFSYSWLPTFGSTCAPGASSGVPPPHVDWTAADAYAVKFSDRANYCSRRCPCGEAPKPEPPCDAPGVDPMPAGGYHSEVMVTSVPGMAPHSQCLPCPAEGRARAAAGSLEAFATDFLRDLAAGSPGVCDAYSDHAVLVRIGGPVITGPPASPSSLRRGPAGRRGGNGGEFFTHLWPGLTSGGTGGATNELLVAVHRIISVGRHMAQLLLFTNGTLYNASTGEMAVPWLAKKVVLSVMQERGRWSVHKVEAMDYNTDGVGKCTFEGVDFSYCSTVCPCGEVRVLEAEQAGLEGVRYRVVDAAAPAEAR